MKKYELTKEAIKVEGKKLYRIRAIVDFGDTKAGDLGGYIEGKKNLDQYGNAWVSGDARVYNDAFVTEGARVCGDARVYGNAWVYGDARVYGNARVFGNAQVCGNVWVRGDAQVCGNARVSGDAQYAYAHGFGSVNRTTTFFRLKDGGVGVSCGCFYGTIQEFKDKVRKTYGESEIVEEYIDMADLMEKRFRRTGYE